MPALPSNSAPALPPVRIGGGSIAGSDSGESRFGAHAVRCGVIAAERHRFAALDAWRGIAALGVAYRHLNGTSIVLANPFHDNLSRSVDFFFVLSGFIIAGTYGDRLARGFSLARFMILRWGRVWPLHATMVLAYVALECVLLVRGQVGGLGGREAFTGPRDLAALPVSFFLMQAWVWPGRDLWNVQSWSISVELGLYLGAALLWRVAGRRALAIGALLALALGGADLAIGAGAVVPEQILRGLVGFGLGMGCWALWPRCAAVRLPLGLATGLEVALVALAVAAICGEAGTLLDDLAFATLVLVFGREQGLVSRLLLTAPLRWLGVLSYSLYMVHGLVFGRVFDVLSMVQARIGAHWVDAHLGGLDLVLLPAAQALVLVVAMLALALACAWVAWRLVEWPARAYSRRLAGRADMAVAPA